MIMNIFTDLNLLFLRTPVVYTDKALITLVITMVMLFWAQKRNLDGKYSIIVPQLSKCLKFEAIRGDQTDQTICI